MMRQRGGFFSEGAAVMDTEALFKRVTGISFSALLEIDYTME